MASILIRDLSDSIELDQEAMQAILGGARASQTRLQLLGKQELKNRSSLHLMEKARVKKLARY